MSRLAPQACSPHGDGQGQEDQTSSAGASDNTPLAKADVLRNPTSRGLQIQSASNRRDCENTR